MLRHGIQNNYLREYKHNFSEIVRASNKNKIASVVLWAVIAKIGICKW